MGPWVVTRDELKDDDISVQCWVNGELRQSANSKDLIFVLLFSKHLLSLDALVHENLYM